MLLYLVSICELYIPAAFVVGIGFCGLAVCLLVICCGVVCLYRWDNIL